MKLLWRRHPASNLGADTKPEKDAPLAIDDFCEKLAEMRNSDHDFKSKGLDEGFGENRTTQMTHNYLPGKSLTHPTLYSSSSPHDGSHSPTEERLRLYHQVLSHAKEGIVIQDADGRIVQQNTAHMDLLGYSDAELCGKTPEYYLEGGRKEFGRTMDDLVQKGSFRSEARCRARSGYWVDVDLSAVIIRDHAGSVLGYATYLRNITEKKRVEGVLRESEERFSAFMNNSPVLAFMLDAHSHFVYVNQVFEKYAGKHSAEILGKSPFEIWPADIAQAFIGSEAHTLTSSQAMEYYEKMALPGQELREWLAIKFPFHDRRESPLVGCVYIDVTERKSLEEQLRQSQKMEAVGRLAGGVAHDFNNLLTIIIGNCELLLGNSRLGPGQQGRVEEIKRAGERAALLTRQLLAFSRKQVLAPCVLELNKVIEDLRRMIERLIGEDIEFVTIPHAKLDRVKADPGQIEQIIMNLVVNARDAMPSGGRLTIETANVEFDESYVQTHLPCSTGEYVMVAVSDTGTGMDGETRKHMFEPFFTTKEKGKGTGLGLATVYGIVKQSGGFIWVYSEPGGGSTFKVYFPRVLEKADSEDTAKPEPDHLRGTETIMVAEDEDSLRHLICETLERCGFKALDAANGKDAIKLSNLYREPIHLLVADVVMPQMSGRELAEKITGTRPDVRVLYISGYSDEAIVRYGITGSNGAFLQKPFSPKTLVRKIRELLGGHTHSLDLKS